MQPRTVLLLFCLYQGTIGIDERTWREGFTKYGWSSVSWSCPCVQFDSAPAYVAEQTFCADLSNEQGMNWRPHFKSDGTPPLYAYYKNDKSWKVSTQWNSDTDFVMVAASTADRPQLIKATWDVIGKGKDPAIKAQCALSGSAQIKSSLLLIAFLSAIKFLGFL